jgi:hypothetical protein
MKKIALLLIAAVAAFACQKPATEAPEITVKTTDLTIPVDGTEDMVVAFNAPEAWTAAIKETQDWCSIAPSSGAAGDASVTVIALENEGKDDRTVTLVITSGTAVKEVVLTQLPVDAFELVESSAYLDERGGSYDLKVKANVPFTVTTDADWVTIVEAKAYVEHTTTLNVAAYDVVEGRRTADIIVSAEGLDDLKFTLVQDGPAAKIWGVDLTTVASRLSKVTNAVNETFSATYSLAVFGDDLVLCIGDGSAPILLNKATGAKKGTLDVGEIKPMSVANDDAGNLILANRVYDYWKSYEFFTVWYIKAGTTEVKKLFSIYEDFEYYTSYVGAGITVTGDVTQNAVIATAWEGVSGVSGECSLLTFDVVNGEVPAYKKLDLTGFTTLSWCSGYWVAAPGDYPGFAFFSTTSTAGGIMAGYDANTIYAFDSTGACSAVTGPLADGNYATNVLELETIGEKTYVAVAAACHFPDYGIAPNIAVYDLETKAAVATPRTTNYALTGEKDADGNPTYKNGVSATADVVLEEVEGGFNVYYVDNNCSAVEAFHYEVK